MMPIVTKKLNVDRRTGLMVEGWPTPSYIDCVHLFFSDGYLVFEDDEHESNPTSSSFFCFHRGVDPLHLA